MSQVLLLNGPNLNLLGSREPATYGSVSLADVEQTLVSQAAAAGHECLVFQSNAEGDLIDRIHAAARDGVEGLVFNPAGYTHTSVALRDALLGTELPFIEVHISNIHRREAFRQHSYFSDIALGCIVGLGPRGYELALGALLAHLSDQ